MPQQDVRGKLIAVGCHFNQGFAGGGVDDGLQSPRGLGPNVSLDLLDRGRLLGFKAWKVPGGERRGINAEKISQTDANASMNKKRCARFETPSSRAP